MQLSNAPGKLPLPFANSGGKNTIPVASQIGITAGAASLTDGFPPLTRTPIAAGGVPPSGLDMNGILYEMSNIVRWANAGGGYPYDSTFATDANVTGYPKGARVLRSDGAGYWFNTTDNNVTDPESSGSLAAGWVLDYSTGVTSVAMTSSNVTLTPLQYGKKIIVVTGILTANLSLIFPAMVGEWWVINTTTGGFTLTAKTASGTGMVVIDILPIICDGTNILSLEAADLMYTPAGTGAVPSSIQTKLQRWNDLPDYDTIAHALAANVYVRIPAGTYALGSTTLTLPPGTKLIGAGSEAVNFTYSGSGVAIDGYGSSGIAIKGISITCSNAAAVGVRLGGAAQHMNLDDVFVYGLASGANTGTGFLLESSHTSTAFSGQLTMTNCYSLSSMYGIRFLGDAGNINRTWTTCTFLNCYMIGQAGGIVPGSAGLYIDALTTLTGSTFIGGTIEAFATGLQQITSSFNSSSGIEYEADIEGCTVPYAVGTNFTGSINLSPAAQRYLAIANGTSNAWSRELHNNGVDTSESYYEKNFIIKMDGTGTERGFNVYMGQSLIAGGTPTFLFGIRTVGTFATPQQSYILFGTHRTSWASAIPTGGTWAPGDVIWNTAPAAGGAPGWVCVTAGTPGTWKAMANLAP